MNKVIDKGFRSCRFVSTIVKYPVLLFRLTKKYDDSKVSFLSTFGLLLHQEDFVGPTTIIDKIILHFLCTL